MWDVKQINGRSLGTEQEIVSYIEQYHADSYCPKTFPSLGTATQYDRMDQYWVCPSFRDESLVPEFAEQPSNHIVPEWLHSFMPEIAIQNQSREFIVHGSSSYTNQSRVHSAFFNAMNRANTNWIHSQYIQLATALKNKGYSCLKGELDLIKIIELRKTQFPGFDIYIMAEEEMALYLKTIYPKHTNYYGAKVLTLSRWRIPNMVKYECIVFAAPQVHTAQEYVFKYEIDRGVRQWDIKFAAGLKTKIVVDDLTDSQEALVTPKLSPIRRFMNL